MALYTKKHQIEIFLFFEGRRVKVELNKRYGLLSTRYAYSNKKINDKF